MASYNRISVAEYFDEYGDKEWLRLVQSPAEEVKLHVHTHYLHKHIRSGAKVLEVGAGAGRFTQILAELGADIVVADISSTQLALNRKHAVELAFADRILEWTNLDVCDLSVLSNGSFDAVVCYGRPLIPRSGVSCFSLKLRHAEQTAALIWEHT